MPKPPLFKDFCKHQTYLQQPDLISDQKSISPAPKLTVSPPSDLPPEPLSATISKKQIITKRNVFIVRIILGNAEIFKSKLNIDEKAHATIKAGCIQFNNFEIYNLYPPGSKIFFLMKIFFET